MLTSTLCVLGEVRSVNIFDISEIMYVVASKYLRFVYTHSHTIRLPTNLNIRHLNDALREGVSRNAFYSWHLQVTKVCSKPFEVLFSFRYCCCCIGVHKRRPNIQRIHPLLVTIIRLDPTIPFLTAIPIKMCASQLIFVSKSLPCMRPTTTTITST